MFHLLQPQAQPHPPTPSIPPSPRSLPAPTCSAGGYDSVFFLLRVQEDKKLHEKQPRKWCFCSMTYNETRSRWSWYILFPNSPLTGWSASEIVFRCWRCLWRHHRGPRMDGFWRAHLSDTRPTWTPRRQCCGSDEGLLCYSASKIVPSVENFWHTTYCHYFNSSRIGRSCGDSEQVGASLASCMSESSLCRTLTHRLWFWNLWVERSLIYYRCKLNTA